MKIENARAVADLSEHVVPRIVVGRVFDVGDCIEEGGLVLLELFFLELAGGLALNLLELVDSVSGVLVGLLRVGVGLGADFRERVRGKRAAELGEGDLGASEGERGRGCD